MSLYKTPTILQEQGAQTVALTSKRCSLQTGRLGSVRESTSLISRFRVRQGIKGVGTSRAYLTIKKFSQVVDKDARITVQ